MDIESSNQAEMTQDMGRPSVSDITLQIPDNEDDVEENSGENIEGGSDAEPVPDNNLTLSRISVSSDVHCSESEATPRQEKSPDAAEKISFINFDVNHDKIESEFKSVLEEFTEDPALASFRVEYARILSALLESHKNERKIMNSCRQLQIDMQSSSAEVEAAVQKIQAAEEVISSYKEEVDKTWRMVNLASERDQETKATMQAFQVEINRLRQAAAKDDILRPERSSTSEKIRDSRNTHTEETESHAQEIGAMKNHLEEIMHKFEEAENMNEELKRKLDDATADLQLQRKELLHETNRKERAEREVTNIRRDIEAKETELKAYSKQLEDGKASLNELETFLRIQKLSHDKTFKDYESLNAKYNKLQQDYEKQLAYGNRLAGEEQGKATEIKHCEDQVVSLRAEINRMWKQRDSLHKQLQATEQKKQELEEQVAASNALTCRLKKDLEAQEKQQDVDKKTHEVLCQEKETLKKEVLEAKSLSEKQLDVIKLHAKARKVQESEIQQLQQANLEGSVVISQLARDKERCIHESTETKQKTMDLVEEQRAKDTKIMDLKKHAAEAEIQLKQQQAQLDAMLRDKNLSRKHLMTAQHMISEMNGKMQITNNQIDRLKDENSLAETQLLKERLEKERLMKEKTNIMQAVDDMKDHANDMKTQIALLEADVSRLNKSIAEQSAENEQLRNNWIHVTGERNNLSTQLVRRNNEISLLREKVRIQQNLLDKGKQHQEQQADDIQLLKTEIKKQKRGVELQGRTIDTMDDMRREMYSLHKELLLEKSKGKALEEELSRPQNVHRWRQLEGSDPAHYELVLKIQALQKRLISKMKEITRKENDLQEKDKLYLELRKSLARQPGAEMAEKLMTLRNDLQQKTRKIKSLSAEVHMYEAQIDEFEDKHKQLNDDLKKTRKQYLQQKKKLYLSSKSHTVTDARAKGEVKRASSLQGFKLAPNT